MAPLVLVAGGTGRKGQLVVQKLQQVGYAVRVLTRHARKAQNFFDVTVDIVEGDLTQPQSVEAAMRHVEGVVIAVESAAAAGASNSPEQVHYQGTRHLLAVAATSTRLVLVTQIYITRPDRYPEMSHIIRWRQQAEAAVRSSGLPYTIVRPSWLTDASGHQGVRLEQGDRGEGQVARDTIAEVCVQALLYPTAHGKTFEVYNEKGTPPAHWSTTFAALHADSVLQET